MSNLFPGLRRAAAICATLARECDSKIEAVPHSPANARRRAESRALRRAASRITDEMLDEPIPIVAVPMKCRRHGCQRWSSHPSGMCDEHQPGFAQAEEERAA